MDSTWLTPNVTNAHKDVSSALQESSVMSAHQRPTLPTECVSEAAPLDPSLTETFASHVLMPAKNVSLEITSTAPNVTLATINYKLNACRSVLLEPSLKTSPSSKTQPSLDKSLTVNQFKRSAPTAQLLVPLVLEPINVLHANQTSSSRTVSVSHNAQLDIMLMLKRIVYLATPLVESALELQFHNANHVTMDTSSMETAHVFQDVLPEDS